MKMKLQILGRNIRRARYNLKLSQEAMAEKCDLHRTYICDIERGARNVTVGSLIKIAQGLRTTVSELTRNVESGTAPEPKAGRGRTPLIGENTTMAGQQIRSIPRAAPDSNRPSLEARSHPESA